MGDYQKIRKVYRFNSIFYKIFIIMLLFSISLISVFTISFYHLIVTNAQKSSSIANLNTIQTVQNSMDMLLRGLHQVITQVSNERSIISAVISHEEDQKKYSAVLSDLSLTAGNNQLIEDIILYIPRHDTVLTSGYEQSQLERFHDAQIITSYLNYEGEGHFIEENGFYTAIYQQDGDTIFARDFILRGQKRLGILFFRLRSNELISLVDNDLQNPHLFVYDGDNNPLFSRFMSYPSHITTERLHQLEQSGNRSIWIDDQPFFYGKSPVTDWQYVYSTDLNSLHPEISEILGWLLPCCLLFFVISLVLSFYVTHKIYQPIHNLTLAVGGAAKKNTNTSRNELEYINQVFSQITDERSNLDILLQQVVPDVTNRLFRELLAGSQMTHMDIKHTLEAIFSPFTPEDSYLVLLCSVDADSISSPLLDILKQELEAIQNRRFLYNLQPFGNDTTAIILSFHCKDSDYELKKTVLHLENQLMERFHQKGILLFLCHGRIYHSIQDVGFSYEEAAKQLCQIKYPQSNHNFAGTVDTHDGEPDHLTVRCSQIVSVACEKGEHAAYQLALRVFEEFLQEDCSLQDLYENCHHFGDLLAEQSLHQHLESLEYSMFHFDFSSTIPEIEQRRQMQASFLTYLEQTVRLISEASRRRQNPHLIAAQKYMETHYSNSSLSLQDVADDIQIHATYLSKLFKKNLGIRFIDYLNELRVEKARELLENKNLTVKEISAQAGFNSVQNFIRVFKKYTGQTPGGYRKEDE